MFSLIGNRAFNHSIKYTHLNKPLYIAITVNTIAQIKGIVSFVESNEISIGPKAVRLHRPLPPDCWRSVELVEIPIGICTVWPLTALPDHLLILLAFSDARQV